MPTATATRLERATMPRMTAALIAKDLRKSYGSLDAVAGLDLEIYEGEVFSLLGPNGAGKTTFVEIMDGYRPRTAGEATVLGVDPGKADGAWRSRIGIVPQTTALFDELTVGEVIAHFASFYPSPMNPSRAIELVGLSDKRRQRCGKLSGGQKRRVELALGIVGDPELIFLDEPTTGLDPEARRQLWDVVREFAALGKTVLLTTHYLDEAEHLADRAGIIIRGKLAALGPPREIGGRDHATAKITFEPMGALATAPLPPLEGEVTRQDGLITVTTAQPTKAIQHLAAWASALGLEELPALRITRPSLEDAYLAMVHAPGQPEGDASNG